MSITSVPAVTLIGTAWIALSGLAAHSVEAQGVEDFEDWQVNEIRSLVETVTSARLGERADDIGGFEIKPSYMRGIEGNTYTPFTLIINSPVITGPSIATYLAVTPVDAQAGGDGELPTALFEDVFYSTVSAVSGEEIHIDRALQAPGGEYDVYVAVRNSEGGVEAEEIGPEPTILLKRERLTIPDFWNDELETSTIFLVETIEPLPEAPTQEEMILFPYTIASARITPKFDSNYAAGTTLRFVFQIYNAGHTAGMPNVQVTYDFYQIGTRGEEFFNRTPPQDLNHETLPAVFNLTQGFQLPAGQQIPLGSFPAGDYRLEMTVIDNEASTEITKDLLFTVEGN